MKIKSIHKKTGILILFILCLVSWGCDKFVEIPDPIDSISSDMAVNTDVKADAAIRYLYLSMVKSTNFAFGGAVSGGLGVSADELSCTLATNAYYDLFTNVVASSNNPIAAYYWGPMYNMIFTANIAIENMTTSTGMTAAGKKQYIAEARFIRAVNYFYLINMFGDVPLTIKSDYLANTNIARSPVADVYNQIIDDLKFAQANLGTTYVGGVQRFRANKYAASAMLARVYLYKQDWVNAEANASDVIDGAGKTVYDIEPTLNNAFLITSKEVILQLLQPATNLYTWDGAAFVPAAVTTAPAYQITDALYLSFETGDLRKTNWIRSATITTAGVAKTYYSPFKYKLNSGTTTTGTRTEALVFLRLSEVYLIRAEARAQQSKLATAITDLDVIRNRAKITLIAATKPTILQPDLLTTIAHERFVELFAELGHRWFDLKRTGKADEILKTKPNWRPEAKLFPIPNGDIITNPSLVQNPGYN